MAQELGPSLAWWLDEPFAFLLWSFYTLQDNERRTGWEERMKRLETAALAAIAFHDPARLEQERQNAIGDAAPRTADEQLIARARRMVADIERGKVLQDDLLPPMQLLPS